MAAPPCYARPMKSDKPPPKIEDIELVPDAWERFVRAVKQVAGHKPVEHPTGHGKRHQQPIKRDQKKS
jgi:hypothetical protein